MEKITINNIYELKPFDMIEEGIFIKTIDHLIDVPYVVAEVGRCSIVKDQFGVIRPFWERLFRLPIKFPIDVYRGVLE